MIVVVYHLPREQRMRCCDVSDVGRINLWYLNYGKIKKAFYFCQNALCFDLVKWLFPRNAKFTILYCFKIILKKETWCCLFSISFTQMQVRQRLKNTFCKPQICDETNWWTFTFGSEVKQSTFRSVTIYVVSIHIKPIRSVWFQHAKRKTEITI